jgi:hypothetical protein
MAETILPEPTISTKVHNGRSYTVFERRTPVESKVDTGSWSSVDLTGDECPHCHLTNTYGDLNCKTNESYHGCLDCHFYQAQEFQEANGQLFWVSEIWTPLVAAEAE